MDYNDKYDDFDHEFAVFEAYLERDLEGWFSADIACCDFCYKDFLSHWPHAYNANEAEFQCNSIDVGVFYSGSRLSEAFSEKRFFELMQYVECPWCLQSGTNNLYPYELPFAIIENFNDYSKELSEIAKKTPFLLLGHPFAKDVLDSLKTLAQNTEAKKLPTSLFRGRCYSDKLDISKSTEFDFAPLEHVAEGRYNHAGTSALYLGDSAKTCFHELRENKCAIGEIKLLGEVKILDLVNPDESHQGSDDYLNTLVYSALLSAPRNTEGNNKKEYIFSRFVADCARAAGFDGIKYPTTRPLIGSFNLVLLNRDFAIGIGSKIIKVSIFDG